MVVQLQQKVGLHWGMLRILVILYLPMAHKPFALGVCHWLAKGSLTLNHVAWPLGGRTIQSFFECDPRGAEIFTSTVIKQKLAESPKEDDSISLATNSASKYYKVPKPTHDQGTAKYADSPIPVDEVAQMMTAAGLSINQVRKITSLMRSWLGTGHPGLAYIVKVSI